MMMNKEKYSDILSLLQQFSTLGIDKQIDYDKFYLYSIITHSTAIEGSTITEIENQLLFDEGIAAAGRTMIEHFMNLDLKAAYERSQQYAISKEDITPAMLCGLSALVMKNTGSQYNTAQGSFDSSKGDLRLLNVSAGFGGRSYMSYLKVPAKLDEFCQWLNAERQNLRDGDTLKAYELSFLAHYRLVTIHPWADGNGRMSRLIMNQLQWEQGLLPTIVYKEHKATYIQALVQAREQDDEQLFCTFMFNELRYFLQHTIQQYQTNIHDTAVNDKENTNE